MKTPWSYARTRQSAILLIAFSGSIFLAGCDPRTLFYFLQGDEPTIAAPGPKFEGKKVVVLSHAVSNAMGEYQSLDHDLSKNVIDILRNKVKEIEVVDADKVWDWVDEHPNWTDPGEIAKAFEADIVVFLEVEAFQLQNQGDLNVFEGTAKTHIQVTELAYPKTSKGKVNKDKPKESKTIYDEYSDTEFPRRGPVPFDSGVSRGAFKNTFLRVVAAEISWHFVPHTVDETIQDVKFNNK